MQQIRNINEIEMKVLDYLLRLANYPSAKKTDLLKVLPMEDGGMGSFLIFENQNVFNEIRTFGSQISEYHYKDDDNVPVIVSLNVDSKGRLFEVDIWKADFSPVVNLDIPNN